MTAEYANALREYLMDIPIDRRERFKSMYSLVRRRFPEAKFSFKDGRPTFETGSGWVAMSNEDLHITVFTPSGASVESFAERHPSIQIIEGRIRLADSDEIPFHDLLNVVDRAMSPS